MKLSLDKLQKFFKLEAERGYDNRAVVGGLEQILESWHAEAQVDNLPEEFIQAISIRLRDYSKLSPFSRYEVLDGLWKRIQRDNPDEAAFLSQLTIPDPSRESETSHPPASSTK